MWFCWEYLSLFWGLCKTLMICFKFYWNWLRIKVTNMKVFFLSGPQEDSSHINKHRSYWDISQLMRGKFSRDESFFLLTFRSWRIDVYCLIGIQMIDIKLQFFSTFIVECLHFLLIFLMQTFLLAQGRRRSMTICVKVNWIFRYIHCNSWLYRVSLFWNYRNLLLQYASL